MLALLFDRSTFIYDLLAAHPEIVEEVLRPEVLRKHKDATGLAEELAAGPAGPGHAEWLWLYVKAEQVRYAIGELLGYLEVEDVEERVREKLGVAREGDHDVEDLVDHLGVEGAGRLVEQHHLG